MREEGIATDVTIAVVLATAVVFPQLLPFVVVILGRAWADHLRWFGRL